MPLTGTKQAGQLRLANPLERDDFSSNRHPALSLCLSMISAQTLRVCREGKPAPTLGSWPEGMLFRIMLGRKADMLYLLL
jgi:hypothetical protein